MIPSSSQLAGVAQLVEFQPSKLAVEGSNPFSRSNGPDADGREILSLANLLRLEALEIQPCLDEGVSYGG